MGESGPSKRSDAELIAAFLSGDAEGFGGIVDRYGGRVFNFIRRYLGHEEDARDVFQETFLAAMRALVHFDATRPLLPWLLGIAFNRCREERRRRRPGRLDESGAGEPMSSDPGPGGRAEMREEVERVVRAVGALDDAHRAVFLLRVYDGFKYSEIGEILNISEGTAKSRMHYAVYNVRKFMQALDEA